MPRSMAQRVQQRIEAMVQRIEEGDPEAVPRATMEISSLCGDAYQALQQVATVAGRAMAEKAAVEHAFHTTQSQLKSLLASPRRISSVLGLLHDQDEEGQPQTWAIVEGPPLQACRIASPVTPGDICDDQPDDPVWVWLIEASPGDFVVAGRIDAPPLLEATSGPEEEMVFEGFEDEEI